MKTLILYLATIGTLSAQINTVRSSTMSYNGDTGHCANGDSNRCSTISGGKYYCTFNDGTGPGCSGTFNWGVYSLTLDLGTPANTLATLIPVTSGYGILNEINKNSWTNGTNNKTGGINFIGGNLYIAQFQQCSNKSFSPCSGLSDFSPLNATILVSSDISAGTAHLTNPKTYAANSNTPCTNTSGVCSLSATGDPPIGPTADSAIMWPGQTHMGYMQFVQFGSGDTADGSSTYTYAYSVSTDFISFYLSRVPSATIMDVSTWSYYVGPVGGDVNLAANWCSTSYSACEASHTIIADARPYLPNGTGDTPTISHFPSPLSAYAMVASFAGSDSLYRNRTMQAKSMTGPYAPVAIDPALGVGVSSVVLTTTVSGYTDGTYLINASAGGAQISVTVSGGIVDCPGTPKKCTITQAGSYDGTAPTLPTFSGTFGMGSGAVFTPSFGPLAGNNFPQFLIDTLSLSGSTGTITAISNGGNTGPPANYAPYFSTYAIGPGSPTYGRSLLGSGMQTMGASQVRLSAGAASRSIPRNGLVQFWDFFDQAQLPTLWPSIRSTEVLGNAITCAKTGGVTITTLGMAFDATGTGASTTRCTTSANAPSATAGNGTYSIFVVAKATTTSTQTALMSTGAATTRNALEAFMPFSSGVPLYWSSFADDIVYTTTSSASLLTSGNYYMLGVTKTAGAPAAANAVLYFGGNRYTTLNAFGSAAPNVTASPMYFGAAVNTGSTWDSAYGGTLLAVLIYNRAVTPVEVRHLYEAMKGLAARRGIVLQ